MKTTDAIRNARNLLLNIEYRRGRGVYEENLQHVLEALWSASHVIDTPGMLEREVFGVLLVKPNGQQNTHSRYLKDLFDRGCFGEKTKVEHSKGLPFRTIYLKEKAVPAKKQQSARVHTLKKQRQGPHIVVPPGYSLVPTVTKAAHIHTENTGDRRDHGNNALVFVDVANITGKDCGGERKLPLGNVNWPEFARLVSTGYGNREPLTIKSAKAYLYEERSDRLAILSNIHFARFEPIFHHKPDTDPLMAGDIGLWTRDAMDTCARLTIVLLSGDGDYCHTLKSLKEMARSKNVVLCIWVITWKGHLSGKLAELADKITYLDMVQNFILGSYVQKSNIPNIPAYAR